MLKVKWVCAFLGLSLLIATQSFGGHPLEKLIDKGDHQGLATHYTQEANDFKTKAEQWEFVAEYYEKFPGAFEGDSSKVSEHIAHLRAIAEDFRKAAHEARDLANQHRSLVRRGQGP